MPPTSPAASPFQAILAADARPLYLLPTGETEVSLDGPALCVRRETRAEQRFPLQRLARVYSNTRIHWRTDALLACADHGIGIVFVDELGSVRARLLGAPGQRDELLHRINEFLLLPQSLDMYRHWHAGQRRRLAWWAGSHLDASVALREPRHCRQWIDRLAIRYSPRKRDAEHSRQWLRGLTYHWMQSHLRDLGFGANSELGHSGEPNLPRDLAELLMWYLEPARIGWLKRRYTAAHQHGQPLRPPRHEDLVRLFESRTTRVGKRGRDLTSALHRWLIQAA